MDVYEGLSAPTPRRLSDTDRTPRTTPPTNWRLVVTIAALAAVYLLTGRLGLAVATVGNEVTLLWAPTGIALAALIVFGLRASPGVFLGAFLVNVWVGGSVVTGLGVATGNTLQAVYGAYLLTRHFDFRPRFERPRDLFTFLAVGVLTGPMISATIGSLTLHFVGGLARSELPRAWCTWWLGDGAGALIVAPLLLTWFNLGRRRDARSVRLGEFTLIVATLAAIPFVIAVTPWPALHHYEFALLIFPVLVWGALRSGSVGASTVSFGVAALAIWAALTPDAPLFRERLDESLALVWALIGVAAPTTLLAAILSERERAMRLVRESERAGRESEARYRAIFEHASDSIWLVDPATGRIEEFNDMAHEALGYTREEFRRLTIADIDALETEEDVREHVRQISETGFERFETKHRSKDGQLRDVLVGARIVSVGSKTRIVSVIRDMTELRRAAEREATLGRLIDQSRNELYVIDSESFRFLMVNRGARTNIGYTMDELRRMTPLDIVPQEFAPMVAELMEGAPGSPAASVVNAKHRRKDGTTYPVEVHLDALTLDGRPVIVAVAVDVSERRRAEEERRRLDHHLQQSQKLESLGVLAGGIAHDFNNLLVGIMGNAGLALGEIPESSTARRHVQDIEVASQRAAELCRQMLAYSGRGRFEVKPLDLSELVDEMHQLLSSSISKSVRLDVRVADDLPAIEADATQLRQVVMNLITNGAEALAPGGGTVRVETSERVCDREFLDAAESGQDLPEGRYVVLTVVDEGAGMEEDARRRMFEPFFTTKEGGKGLGLAAALGIVRGHGGAIRVESEAGRGTRIDVLLPPSAKEPEPKARAERPAAAVHGRGAILVVDDEALVRDLARRALSRHGFEVVTASNGREAVTTFEARASELDCVLLDLTMPGLSGAETFERLREIRSDVPVILSSGYDRYEMSRSFGSLGFSGFLQKPYHPRELVERIQSVLQPDAPTYLADID